MAQSKGTGTINGSKEAANRWLLPTVVLLQFSVALLHVGLRKQFINNLVFPIWACAAGFNYNYNDNNDNNINNNNDNNNKDYCSLASIVLFL